jgi:ribosomal protein L37AE/L43A
LEVRWVRHLAAIRAETVEQAAKIADMWTEDLVYATGATLGDNIRSLLETTMSDILDLQACEVCGSKHPIENMTMMEDCWFCPKCVLDFKTGFDSCTHRWTPHTDTMGDSGWYCERCTGFVNDDYFPLEAYIGKDTPKNDRPQI